MQPYTGEIRLTGLSFAPQGWADCNGSLLNIQDYTSLFTLIGTTYGGDGIETFALPDLRGRLTVGAGPLYPLAQTGGSEEAPLTSGQIPFHNHTVIGSGSPGSARGPAGAVHADGGRFRPSSTGDGTMVQTAASGTSRPQSVSHIQPVLTCRYIICLEGIFPTPP